MVVEGPHDVEFVCQLLSPRRLGRVQLEKDLDPFFHRLIPHSYPPNGDLLKRVPVPLFLQNATHAVAIHSAVGDTRLVQTLEENSAILDITKLSGIGILLDSDSRIAPHDRYRELCKGLLKLGYEFPKRPGEVGGNAPRLGAFVVPDNLSAGTLEDLLLDCAMQVYPNLLASATGHVDAASADKTLLAADRRELRKPAGRNKAIISSMASILRPGKAVQVSIQDNRWLRGTGLALPRVRALQNFLKEVLEL